MRMDDLARDPTGFCGSEEANQSSGIVRHTQPAQRRLGFPSRFEVRRDPASIGNARVNGVHRDPQRCYLGTEAERTDRALRRNISKLAPGIGPNDWPDVRFTMRPNVLVVPASVCSPRALR